MILFSKEEQDVNVLSDRKTASKSALKLHKDYNIYVCSIKIETESIIKD